MNEAWDASELKARMRQITGFNDCSPVYFPDFAEDHGQDDAHMDLSMAALQRYTRLSTAEFAVRPFIIKQEACMMQRMTVWGQTLSGFKKSPSPVPAVLERLKADPSLYVRKSVTSNLNVISKIPPDLVTKIAKVWYGRHEHTDWIANHGCRTLLKKGNTEVLFLFGYYDAVP